MKFILLIVLATLFISCSKSKMPNGILEPEKMQAVFWDYMRADVYANEYLRKDSGRDLQKESAKLQQQVFQLHKISREQFYKSYEYYLYHTNEMKIMLDTLQVRQQNILDFKKYIPERKWTDKKFFLKYNYEKSFR